MSRLPALLATLLLAAVIASIALSGTEEKRVTRYLPVTSSLERSLLCIHRGEGAWDSDTGNGYYGGLQMDRNFQATYGPEFLRAWGTANHWPASVQMVVAIRAYLSGRKFNPWPQTSRACGL